jgi:hypothetical protein
MNTKKLNQWFPVALLLLLSINTAAQSSQYQNIPRRSANSEAKKLSKKQIKMLKLNNNQSIKIKAINLDIARRMDNLKTTNTITEKQKTEEYKALMDERNDEYQQVMNADQYQKWNTWIIKKPAKIKTNEQKRVIRQSSSSSFT